MKKILSLTLVLAMVMSMGITTAFAAGNWEGGTTVTYTADGAEEWTVTVPATLAPGGSGTVTLEGTWADNRIVTITADPTVTLTNSIKAEDQKVLDVTFAGISEAGSNTSSQTFTENVSVADIENALFGTWSGKFNYNVAFVERISFTYGGDPAAPGHKCQAEAGMTWEEWVNSEYNTENLTIQGEYVGNTSYALGYDVNNFVLSSDEIVAGQHYVQIV